MVSIRSECQRRFIFSFSHRLHVSAERRRVTPGITGSAEPALVWVSSGLAAGLQQSFHTQIAERIGPYESANFIGRVVRGDQLFVRRRVYAVIAWRDSRRTTDAHVHFACSGV